MQPKNVPSAVKRARRVVAERTAAAAQAAADAEVARLASLAPTSTLVVRELGSRILRALSAPPHAWGEVRGVLRGLSVDQLERIAAICEERR
jgi:hypothetical protein